MNLLSSVVFGLAILGVLLVINATFNHKYDYSRAFTQESFEQVPVNISDIQNLKGNIISLQNNGSIIPAWIVSGKWQMSGNASNNSNTNTNTNTTTKDIKFTASVTMTSMDGTNTHKHRLTEFKPSNVIFQNRTSIIDGSVTLSTSEDKLGIIDKRLSSVPIEIKIMNIRTISIDIDKKMVKDHFGNSPIYGKVD